MALNPRIFQLDSRLTREKQIRGIIHTQSGFPSTSSLSSLLYPYLSRSHHPLPSFLPGSLASSSSSSSWALPPSHTTKPQCLRPADGHGASACSLAMGRRGGARVAAPRSAALAYSAFGTSRLSRRLCCVAFAFMMIFVFLVFPLAISLGLSRSYLTGETHHYHHKKSFTRYPYYVTIKIADFTIPITMAIKVTDKLIISKLVISSDLEHYIYSGSFQTPLSKKRKGVATYILNWNCYVTVFQFIPIQQNILVIS